jgi:hypothetical protein
MPSLMLLEKTLLLAQRIRYADRRPIVVQTDHDDPTSRISERHDVLEDRLRG